MSATSQITTHVLDLSAGHPAAGLAVALERLDVNGIWQEIAKGVTNTDGRLLDWLPATILAVGTWRLVFATGDYFRRQSAITFYPRVTVEFLVGSADEHYHVPLLLSRFGYSTYRGS